MASTYLTRTVSSAGNRKTFTYSAWIKRGIVNTGMGLFGQGNRSSSDFDIRLENSGTLRIEPSGFDIKTNAVYRDPSAWYHFVIAIDTTQATASDRVKIYVNGVQVTSFATATYPSLNYDTVVNSSGSTGNVVIGDVFNSTGKFDGSMSHINFIDGTAYDASAFGETDATTGIWKPKTAPSVTYGTNGLFLKFENSGAMGTDSSGNANNFTVNGSMTQNLDTPSNVFATLNPLDYDIVSSNTFSNGNTTLASGGNGSRTTLAASAGKWYAECSMSATGIMNGVQDISKPITSNTGTVLLLPDIGGVATLYVAGSSSSYGSAWSASDIMCIAMDLDSVTKKVYFAKNGQWWNGSAFSSASPDVGTTLSDDTFYAFRNDSGVGIPTTNWNFGNGYFGTTAVASAQNPDDGIGIFEYSVPTGYRALCTKSINAEEYN